MALDTHGEPSNQLMRRPPSSHVSYQTTYADDEDAKLERRAVEAQNAALRARKSIPPFVQKLSSFLDESRNTELIRWSDDGDSFIVLDEDEFARTLIPELFKHNNYASFVRQLNMYGFHKRVGLSDNSMRASERKNKTPSEYSNPYFKRGRPLLLWLIQKPKSAASKSKSTKARAEDGDEDGDDLYDAENQGVGGETESSNLQGPRQPLMIGEGDRSLRPNELQAVNEQLRQIRQQQTMITSMLAKIRQEHEQLYGQAAAFTDLHTRHENSINAILTFLATVYNRSLEGQANTNMANLFAGAIPHEMQQQGNVVDVGDFDTDGINVPGLTRRLSKRQLLLQAPPGSNQTGSTTGGMNAGMASRAAAANPQYRPMAANAQYPPSGSGQIEEIYDQDTPKSSSNMRTPGVDSTGQDFMSLINSANAHSNTGKANMDFPEALSHLQTADGKSPLSPQEREDVLQLMANSSNNGNRNSNNALVSPAPPNVPNLDNWTATDQDLQYLEKSLKEQNAKVAKLTNLLEPLSPSGAIPGLNDTNYTPPPDGLDINNFFDADGYFNDAANLGQEFGGGLDFGGDAGGGGDDGTFANTGIDFHSGGNDNTEDPLSGNWGGQQLDADGGRVVGTASSSEAASPATPQDVQSSEEGQNPRKRRRKN